MRSSRRQSWMLSRLMVALLTVMLAPIWGSGSARGIWVSVLRGPAEHQCSCSLAPGHHCKCPNCLEEAHHERSDTPQWNDTDCDDDHGDAELVAQVKVLLPAPPSALTATATIATDEFLPPAWQSRVRPPPEPPPPNVTPA